jgi:hypothetical protein
MSSTPPTLNDIYDGNAPNPVGHSQKRPVRLPAWVLMMICSIVVLAASSRGGSKTGAEKWVIALGSLSLILSLFAIVAYLIPNLRISFMGELAEAALSLFLLVCWIAGLPIIMAPTRFLAVAPSNNGLNYVLNANLYFFSWAAFLCIVFISFSLVVETISGAQEAVSSMTPKLLKWYMLVITSLVVMASAAQFQQSQNCTNVQSITCSSNKFAISLGVIGFVAASLVVAVMSCVGTLSIYIETGVALFLFIMYTAGVGVITFDYGSGVTIGNLYFSTWAGFIITIFLLVECYQGVTEAQTIHGNGTENGAKHSTNGGDIAVESIEEEDDYI